jgi:hypothetical protein
VNVFFACGAPKSGTTWLQRILDAHPEVCCSGEGHFVSRFTAPLARVVNSYNSGLALESEHVYQGNPYYMPVSQADFDDLARGFILKRMSARADRRTRWVGDKTPIYTRHLDHLHRIFPEAKIIHIVRDPRDVAVSRMGHSRRAGFPEVFAPETDEHRQTLEGAVRTWIEAVTAVDAFAQAHPALVHEVGYGDLHEDPVGKTTALFQFLGAPVAPALIEGIVAATSFKTISGRDPGQEDAASFLRKGVVGDWRAQLPPQSVQFVTEACGELMRRKRFA